MAFLGLNWFRSEKEKELEQLKVEEQKTKNKLFQLQLDQKEEELKSKQTVSLHSNPFKRLKLVNNVLTVVLNDNTVYSKSNATEEDVNLVKTAKNEDNILKVFVSKEQIEQEEKLKDISKNLSILVETGDFEQDGGSLYMKLNGKRINRSLPPLLVDKFINVLNLAEYNALKKFWLKCCTNPNARSAEDLYAFLDKHQFKIDKHGNFYAYRRVVSKNTQNKELIEFVSNTYAKIKGIWKKKPSDFCVFEENGKFGVTKSTGNIGNLEELYLNLPNMQENNYTDGHTQTYDYRVGQVYSMPRNEGNDDNTVSCSKGFHGCNPKLYNYSSFGDTRALMIVNPSDVLSVPVGEEGKFRTCRWFFAAVLGEDEEFILDNEDFDVEELGDVFEEKCLENLQEYVQNSFAEEVKRHTFTLSNISSSELTNIVKSLEQMKETIQNRVKQV